MSELKRKTKTYLIPGYHIWVVCPAFSKTQFNDAGETGREKKKKHQPGCIDD